MSKIEPQDIIDNISDEYADEVTEEMVRAEIESFRNFGLGNNELRSAVIGKVESNLGISTGELTAGEGRGGDSDSPAPAIELGSIDSDDEWVSVEAEVVQIWDNDSDAIAQVGLLDDGTGRVKFTSWAKSELMWLSEGEQYRFENVVTEDFQGRMQVKLNSATDIEILQGDEKMDISNEAEVTGAFVAMQVGSGLIERCTEEDCGRPLQKERCSEHGSVEGRHDLRIKGVLDDGHETYNFVCDRETTEEITDLDLESAKQIAKDALDKEAVVKEITPDLVGRFYTIRGAQLGDLIVVDEFERSDTDYDAESLLVKARSL